MAPEIDTGAAVEAEKVEVMEEMAEESFSEIPVNGEEEKKEINPP